MDLRETYRSKMRDKPKALALIDHFVAQGFAGAGVKELIRVAPSVEDAMKILVDHQAARTKQAAQ